MAQADTDILRRALSLYAAMFAVCALIILGGIAGMALTGTGRAHYWLDDSLRAPFVAPSSGLELP